MRQALLARVTIGFVTTSFVVFGCAQIAGLDDEGSSTSSSGSSGPPISQEAGPTSKDGLAFDPAQLEVPTSDCGKESVKSFSLFNNTPNPATYKVTSIDSVFVVKKNGSGTIPAGGAAQVEIGATPTLAQSQETGLQVEWNGAARPYPVKIVGQGASFELSQTAIDFGDVRKENGAEAKIKVTNGGGRPLDTTLEPTSPTSDFEITPALIHADPKGQAEITVRLKTGASHATPVVVAFKPKATGICGPLPTLDVRGKRITTDVTVDVVDWGDVLCRSNPADRDATIKNYGPNPINFTASITGTLFTIKSPTTGTVGGGSETNPTPVKVKLGASPGTVPGQKDETFKITYGSGAESTGKVREYVAGLVLQIAPGSFNFASDGTTEQRRKFDISNNAGKFGGFINLNAGYQVTGAGFRVENGTGNYVAPYLIFPPSSGSVDVVFKSAAMADGTLTVTGPVCSQNAVTLNGNKP